MTVEIRLDLSEILSGAMVGVMRQTENLKARRAPAHGETGKIDWQLHCEGALGERAVAKFLGVYWSGKGKLRAPAVGEFDVRTSPRHDRDLILHREDPDDRIVWLATGRNGVYRVHGWIRAGDGKREEWRGDKANTGRPAFFVPQSALNPPLEARSAPPSAATTLTPWEAWGQEENAA